MIFNNSKHIFQSQLALRQSKFLCNNTPLFQFSEIKKEGEKLSFWQKFVSPESYTASEKTNRWLMALPAALAHLCIGGPYAWSILASTITKEYGVVASSALDWSLAQSTLPLSITFIFQGLSAAAAGSLQMKYGLRLSMLAASSFYCSGVLLGAAGIYMHSLPLLYLGYGVLAGIGVGTTYTPPIQALIEWFPDRKGLASGLCIAGFGSGALVFAPVVQNLTQKFQVIPEYLGKLGSVETFTESGKMFAKIGSEIKEVVAATASDLAKLPGGGIGLEEGLYVVGTGSTGAAAALGFMGLFYTGVMLLSSLAIKKPVKGYLPKGFDPSLIKTAVSNQNVCHTVVMKTPQFWSFMTFLVAVASGGVGLMSVAKSLMMDQFSMLLPSVVTTTFATHYVLMLSAGNMLGRLGWTQLFDIKGGKFVYNTFGAIAFPLYLTLPMLIGSIVSNPSVIPLYGFIASSTILISIMGGTYASLPAYESQVFGTKYVGPIHGKMLLGSSFAALIGPNLLIQVRNHEEKKAIYQLLDQVDVSKFQQTFSVGVEKAEELIKAKTLTINKLMTMVPPDVKDPTPFLYNNALYTLAGFIGVAAIAHSLLKPVDQKFFEVIKSQPLQEQQNEKKEKKEGEEDEEGQEKKDEKQQKN